MLNCEKYYRRSFNLLNELLELYKNGYNEIDVQRFIYKRNIEKNNNIHVFNDENQSFTFSALITLLGINRENIEDTGRNTDYLNYIKFNDDELDSTLMGFYQKFLSFRNINTGVDEWLSVVKNLDLNQSNSGYLQKVRNALLHSHFEPLMDDDLTRVWNKNKSGFEAYLFNYNFFQFIIAYFGNTARIGLKDKCLIYMAPKEHEIKSLDDLKMVVDKISIQDIKYSLNKDYKGYNSFEYQLQKLCLPNEEIDEKKFKKLCRKFNNLGIDVEQVNNISLDENAKNVITFYISNYYGDSFYKLDYERQRAIIISLCEYIFDSHSLVSNWALHFIHVISSNNIDKKYFEGDELVDFCAFPSLLLIKAYHLLYRLQYDGFEEIDYNLINFDMNKDDFYFYEGNSNAIVPTTFINSINKLQNKRPDLNNVAVNNKIICDIIRDSLAHGNIDMFLTVKDGKLEHVIEFKDIYRGNVRGIQMTIDKFNLFLQSESFLPKYAYIKTNNYGRGI